MVASVGHEQFAYFMNELFMTREERDYNSLEDALKKVGKKEKLMKAIFLCTHARGEVWGV